MHVFTVVLAKFCSAQKAGDRLDRRRVGNNQDFSLDEGRRSDVLNCFAHNDEGSNGALPICGPGSQEASYRPDVVSFGAAPAPLGECQNAGIHNGLDGVVLPAGGV